MALKYLLRQLRYSNSHTCSWCLACTKTTILGGPSCSHFDCLRPLTFSNLCWLACKERDSTGNMASVWCTISQNPYSNQWKTCQKRRCCNKCCTTLQRKYNFLQQRCCMSCKCTCKDACTFISLVNKDLSLVRKGYTWKLESYFSAKTTLGYIFNSFHALMLLLLSDWLWPYRIHQENKMFCQHISNLMDHDFHLPARIRSLHVLFYGYYLRHWAMAVSHMNHF